MAFPLPGKAWRALLRPGSVSIMSGQFLTAPVKQPFPGGLAVIYFPAGDSQTESSKMLRRVIHSFAYSFTPTLLPDPHLRRWDLLQGHLERSAMRHLC